MFLTRDAFNSLIESHKQFYEDVLDGKLKDKRPDEILDTSGCKLGIFINHFQSRIYYYKHGDCDTLPALRVAHSDFHYYASVIVLLQRLGAYVDTPITDILREKKNAVITCMEICRDTCIPSDFEYDK